MILEQKVIYSTPTKTVSHLLLNTISKIKDCFSLERDNNHVIKSCIKKTFMNEIMIYHILAYFRKYHSHINLYFKERIEEIDSKILDNNINSNISNKEKLIRKYTNKSSISREERKENNDNGKPNLQEDYYSLILEKLINFEDNNLNQKLYSEEKLNIFNRKSTLDIGGYGKDKESCNNINMMKNKNSESYFNIREEVFFHSITHCLECNGEIDLERVSL